MLPKETEWESGRSRTTTGNRSSQDAIKKKKEITAWSHRKINLQHLFYLKARALCLWGLCLKSLWHKGSDCQIRCILIKGLNHFQDLLIILRTQNSKSFWPSRGKVETSQTSTRHAPWHRIMDEVSKRSSWSYLS